MELNLERHRLVVVVGSGGVGKTTLAASLALLAARSGRNTLVMTFDPSLRLKDALGVGDEAREHEVRVPTDTTGSLHASLLDAKRTFDGLVERHAPDAAAAERILRNRFYEHLAGNLTGTTIDYQESMMGAGFVFNNPNAKHSCGCGSSYSA